MNKTSGNAHDPAVIRGDVRRRYGSIAAGETALTAATQSCCGQGAQAATLGYSAEEIAAAPDGANLGLGCGNPVALASLKAGQTVLDLGAGAGFDAFIAARAVGPTGRVAVSDVVAREELSDEVKRNLALHSGCLAGATLHTELAAILKEARFVDVVIKPKGNSDAIITSWEAKRGFESKVFAAEVTAVKPAGVCCAPRCCG